MCGICGFVSDNSLNIEDMVRVINHRGPDSNGIYKDDNLALGHVRLSILDLSDASNQPMVSQNGKYIIVYNGEVYNFKELKGQLQSKGVKFSKESDTEVILEGFVHWGVKLFEKLNGMFAFVIYDKEAQKLYLVRDRFGIKPLYYYFDGKDLIFASEIKSILQNRLKKELNYQAFYEYLHFATALGENTFYKNIKQLVGGYYIEFDIKNREFKIKEYKLNYDIEPTNDSFEESVVKVRELFERAVKRQLVSDVPVGIFLSGGIDSTAITAYASKHYGGKIDTFSAGFDFDSGQNELPLARKVAKQFGTNHHEMHIKGENIIEVLEDINYYFDQPFGDAANIPLYLMSKELKGRQKVILQGDGGDELFAGYHRYNRLYHYAIFKAIAKAFPLIKQIIPKSSSKYKGLRFLYAIYQDNPSYEMAYILSQEMFDEDPKDYFDGKIKERLNSINPFKRYSYFYNLFKDLDPVNRALYIDTNIILPDLYFPKVDRATMANSIEVRVPFLDNDLASYAMSLPGGYKTRGKDKKFLLKRAFDGILPNEVLYGPKKGFGVPFGYWLKSSMKDFMIETLQNAPFYNSSIEKLIHMHITNQKDNSYILWKLLHFSMWLKKSDIII